MTAPHTHRHTDTHTQTHTNTHTHTHTQTHTPYIFVTVYPIICGTGSSVGIATDTGWTVRDRIPMVTRLKSV